MINGKDWYQYSNDLIDSWVNQNNVEHTDVARVKQILTSGTRDDRINSGSLQCPEIYIPGLRSQPWYDPSEFSWASLLESNYNDIKTEFKNIYDIRNRDRHPENTKLASDGVWGSFYFYRSGESFSENMEICPKTSAILSEIQGIKTAGSVFFSTLSRNSNIIPHYGPHNFRIRCHMGMIVPGNCFISVGGVKKNWSEGKCIIFDDSFLHYVENNSECERVVLILDVWHPDLTEVEISLLTDMMKKHVELVREGQLLKGLPESVREFT